MRYLGIGELSRQVRMRASALRYYESVGLLPTAGREGGRRVWPTTAVRRIALIKMAQRAGFTRRLLHADTSRGATRAWRDLAARKLPELDRHIAQTQALRGDRRLPGLRLHELRELRTSHRGHRNGHVIQGMRHPMIRAVR